MKTIGYIHILIGIIVILATWHMATDREIIITCLFLLPIGLGYTGIKLIRKG